MSVYCYECMKPNLPDGIRSCPGCGAKLPYEAQDLRDCPPGTVLNGRYLLGKAIGHGGFGVTYIALDLKTSQRVCVKEYNPKYFSHRKPSDMSILLPDDGDDALENYHKYKQDLLQEAKRLIELRNVPGVVRCYESFECNNTAYMVLEYLEGSDLKQFVLRNGGPRNPPSMKVGVQLTCEVLDILSAVHKHKLLHRDISPDNIFLTKDSNGINGTVKLIDFGSARNTYVEEMTGFNKAGYAAPEMVNGGKEGPYTDLYSVGGVLYFLLMGEKSSKINGTDQLNAPSPARSTPELTIVFKRATDPQPEARYQSAETMKQDLMYCLQQLEGGFLPSNNSHSRLRGLLIGTLSVTTAGLIGLIVMVGIQGNQEPATPTALIAPMSSATSEPTLVKAPQERYVMIAGTTAELDVIFSDGQLYNLDLRVTDGDSITVSGSWITAAHAGTAVVEYSIWGETHRFTVEVVEMPQLTLVSQQTKSGYMENRFGMADSYILDIPKGDTFVLSLPEIPGVSYELVRSTGSMGNAEIAELTDDRLIIKGSQEQQARYAIRLNGIFASQQPEIQLDVTVSAHVVVSDIEPRYTVLAGDKVRIPIYLSDDSVIDLSKDISDIGSLEVEVDPADPRVLVFSCNESGEYNVKICESRLYFTILDAPVQSETELLETDFTGREYLILQGSTLELPLVFRDGTAFDLRKSSENESIVSVRQTDDYRTLLLEGNGAGKAEVTVENQVFTVTSAAADVRPADTADDAVDLVGTDLYMVRLNEGESVFIPLENTPELYRLDCGGNHEDCGVEILNDEILIIGSVKGTVIHDIWAVGTQDGGRKLFSILVQVDEVSPSTSTPIYRLEQEPAESYSLILGQTQDIPLSYSTGGSYPLQLEYDSSLVHVSQPDENTLRVTASQEGTAVIYYVSDGKRCSFRVEIQEAPDMELQASTEYRYITKTSSGYELDLPLGDSAVLLLAGPDGVTFEAVPLQEDQGAKIISTEGQLTVSTSERGSYVYSIRPVASDVELYRLQVNVNNRVVTSALEKNYTLLVGHELSIDLTYSDQGPVDVSEINAPADLLSMRRDAANPNRLIVTALKRGSGFENVSICEEYVSFTILDVPKLVENELVNRVASTYMVELPVNTVLSLMLENSNEQHSYTFSSAVNTGATVDISEDGKSLIVKTADTVGTNVWDVYDHGVFIFRLQADAFSTNVTNDLADCTLFEGSTHTWDLEYAHSLPVTPEITCSRSDVVKTTLSDDGRQLTVEALEISDTDTEVKIAVGGQTFTVTVCSDDVTIMQQPGLASDTAPYILTMDDNDPTMTLQLYGVSDVYDLHVNSPADASAVLTSSGSILTISPLRVGTSTFTISSSGTNDDRELLQLQVVVNFGEELIGVFTDRTCLAGETVELPLTFRNGVAFDVSAASSSPNVVSVTVKDDKLALNCLQAGQATITLEGQTFTVTVAERVSVTGTGITYDGNGQYALSVFAGETASIRLTDSPDGYKVYITDSYGRKEQMPDDSWNQPFDSVGTSTYTLTAECTDFEVVIGTLKVTVNQPVLTTTFNSSYTVIEDQQYYIDLSSEGRIPSLMTEVAGDASALQITQDGGRLYFIGRKAGSWQVTVNDGTSEQIFTVEVAEMDNLLSMGGTELEQNAQGHYILSLVPGYDVQLQLNLPEDCTYSSYRITTQLGNACTITCDNATFHLRPSQELLSGGQLLIMATHNPDGMTLVNNNVVIATIDVTIKDVWMISENHIDVLGQDMVTVMRDVLGALKKLHLWSGIESSEAKKIYRNGQVSEGIWAAMETVRSSYPGFSGMPYYTRKDYLRLIEIGKEISDLENAVNARHAALKADVDRYLEAQAAASSRVNKASFSIRQAAYGNGKLYLIDTEGYLITFNISTMSVEAVDSEYRYKLVTGNGDGVVAVDENNAIVTFGLPETLAERLENIITDVSQIAVTEDGVVLVLGPGSSYTLTGNTDLSPKTGEITLTEGQALYIPANPNDAVTAAGMGGKGTPASNVSAVAAGDSALAFVGATTGYTKRLYVRFGDTSASLLESLGQQTNVSYNTFQSVFKTVNGDTSFRNAKSIAVSDDVVAAVWDGGIVYMFGSNEYGQLGVGNSKANGAFRQVKCSDGSTLKNVEQVVLLKTHTLLRDTSGRVWICGTYSGGKSSSATEITGLSGVKQLIRLDDTRALAIDGSGNICVLQNGNTTSNFFTVMNRPVQEEKAESQSDFESLLEQARKRYYKERRRTDYEQMSELYE